TIAADSKVPSGITLLDDIFSLSSLKRLYLNNFSRLQGLPKLPQSLRILGVENCISLKTLESSSYISSIEFSGDYWFNFNYCNCLNLDKIARRSILADAQFYFKEMANAINNTLSSPLEMNSISKMLLLKNTLTSDLPCVLLLPLNQITCSFGMIQRFLIG
ncbi:uncharacterized protein LOC126668637, partial [Mercurialis annua]|uniref:uncharacterized protein LOC126668637 n=1 Tax=Mercurialis annua TaxID=3986 RepID=UPI00215FDC5A